MSTTVERTILSITPEQLHRWEELGKQLRVDSIRCTTAAGSGHPTSSMSASDLMAVLLDGFLSYDFSHPENPHNDHLIFSKGHAAPLLYSMYRAANVVSDEELLSLRKFGSRLEGHPTPVIPWVDVATGSLGQGLPIAVGLALAARHLDKDSYRVWVLLGDSEMAEGSVWEAFDHAGNRKLSNLVAILDMNRLGQRGPTELQWNSAAYAARAMAFGWRTAEIDGHDHGAIARAYQGALEADQPTLIVAKTQKGSGVSFLANQEGWHGKALSAAEAEKAIAELGGPRHLVAHVTTPMPAQPVTHRKVAPSLPAYELGSKMATRRAYGDALRSLGAARDDIVALDGEVSNSTYADVFGKAFPDRFFEMYIAEQQLVAAAVGMQVRGYVSFASTFAAFLSRAYDFIRMAAISRANLRLSGSHAGVSIGADGPSQMALEDLAMMRAVHGSAVLYPSDGNQAAKLVALMADHPGISYIRTTREATTVIYPPDVEVRIGGCAIVRESASDQAVVVGAGITLHEALRAHSLLTREGIAVRVIDLYSVKPIDGEALAQALQACSGRLVVVEDHWPEGGLGEAVLTALAEREVHPRYTHLAVRSMPGSGEPSELLSCAGIDAEHIADAVRQLTKAG
ncbi:MAG: transketolase [Chloroflexi bacterium]|nr:transketolase [Chloroflexota bacterium]